MTSDSPPRRGDVVRLRLDPVEGSQQGGERPGLVISPDFINRHSPVVLVAAITSRKTEKIYPLEALLEPGETGLPERSKVLLMHLRSLDQRRISGRYGTVGASTMERIETALRVAVGLTHSPNRKAVRRRGSSLQRSRSRPTATRLPPSRPGTAKHKSQSKLRSRPR